jgi:hypothetical protein
MKILCPALQDDWIHFIIHPHYPNGLFWCPECEAVWFLKNHLFASAQIKGVTFVRVFDLKGFNLDFWQEIQDNGPYDYSEE